MTDTARAQRPAMPVLPALSVERLARRVAAGPDPTRVTTRAPFTGEPLADLPESTPGDVDRAFARARGVAPAWAGRPVRERAAVFLRLHDALLDRQAEILDIVQAETGKARRHAFEEVLDVAITCRYVARRAPGLLRPRRRTGALPVLTHAVELRPPKGVVGLVSPWNYPLALSVGDAVPALVAGNAVVSRPDTRTALTTLWALELAGECGLPDDVWQVVLGDGPVVGAAVVDRADFVGFTGSTDTGREVAARAAARLVGSSLELGGKNPMLVLDDADLDRAATGAVHACFASAGQLCVSVERMYIDERVLDPFLERFLARVEELRLGAGTSWTIGMGSLTSRRQLDLVTEHVEQARRLGARVLTGGRARPDLGPLFFEPTVLAGVTPEMTVHAQETFGPVVCVHPVAGEAEAIARANDSVYGLNASVWTRDTRRGRRVAERLRTGIVNVNDGYAAAYGSPGAPMGGMGESGWGRRHGAGGLLKYTDARTVATQRLLPVGAPPGVGEEQWARVLTAGLRAMKALRMR